MEKPISPPPDLENYVKPPSFMAKMARRFGPVLLELPTIYEANTAYHNEWVKSHDSWKANIARLEGGVHGALDTFLPGITSGYSDVVGSGDLTGLDRLLNAADDATASVSTFGAAAMMAETAGLVTIPATIPTGIATLAAGVANLGVNAVKGILKATGLAGADEDGGYIHDGIVDFEWCIALQ